MSRMRNIIKSTAEYTESFSGFRGIAPEGDDSVKSRLAYCENVYRDYDGENAGAIESVPGFRLIYGFGRTLNGLFPYKGNLVVHAGNVLYLLELSNDRKTCEITQILDICDSPSSAFTFGDKLYVLDGENVVEVYQSGVYSYSGILNPDFYVPTLYLNGKAYEQRNLLTDAAIECYDVIDARENAMETEGIRYSITDGDRLLCAVSGIDEGVSGELDIPGYKSIGGVRYRVCEIANGAFSENSSVTEVRIGEGVERIGKMAFYGCTALTRLTTPASLVSIDDAAFNTCPSLSEIYLRSGLSYIGTAAFAASLGVDTVHYEGSEEELASIEGCEALGAFTKKYYSIDTSLRAQFKLSSGFESVKRISVNGEEVEYTLLLYEDGLPGSVVLSLDRHWQYNGMRLSVEGVLPELRSDFNGTDAEGSVSARTVIQRCTVMQTFDGRVFLSGNPDLPSTVFYCSRTKDGRISPLYFGEHNYFNDGTDASPVVSLLAVRNTLAVFKSGSDSVGGIFYHVGKDTEDDLLPRIYPVSDVHASTGCLGAAISFLDEALFLSALGLNAIERQTVSIERSISRRSGSIASHLLREDLANASLHIWMGYIAVCCGTRIYLADPRATYVGSQGNLEYEWFIINGVGAYDGTKPIYRYSACSSGGGLYVKSELIDEICTDPVYSGTINGRTVFFTRENGTAYELYRTDELSYTSLSAPSVFRADGKTLYFGTKSGSIYAFNSDMRGIIPTSEVFSYSDYPDFKRRIHPYYYSFNGVAPRYVIRTVKTDCSVPHLTKSTVKGSLTVKLGRGCAGRLVCEVGTDRSGYRECAVLCDGGLDFAALDFSRMTLAPEANRAIVIKEKEKSWVEKDVTLYSKDFVGPIAVYGLAFRYKIKGRIKQS